MARKKGVAPKEPLPKGVPVSQIVQEEEEYRARLRQGNFFYSPREWIGVTGDRDRDGRSRRDGDMTSA